MIKLVRKQSLSIKSHHTNSDTSGPHLQKRVIWEKGAGVSIRPHTQQQKVKHRKTIPWKGLNLKIQK